MLEFKIKKVEGSILEELQHKIDQKTKPLGALGQLETVAKQIGGIQNTLSPVLIKPTIAVFAGDHGIAEEGQVNPFPQEVTWQMVFNFLSGGAAINVFAKQQGINVKVVDAGVKFDFENHPDLIHSKVAQGTANYRLGKAMTTEQCLQAIGNGAKLAQDTFNEGSNIIGFGEMGIGNTSSAALLMSSLTGLSLEECVGKGTGLNSEGVNKKLQVLQEVQTKHGVITDAMECLTTYGGFEIATMVGAMLKSAELGMTLMIDGFIVTSALLVASKINPVILDYCVFCHTSEEKGHQKLLTHLNADPLLNLNMRLGEGTGAAVAFPMIQASVAFLNEMASFESAEVTNNE